MSRPTAESMRTASALLEGIDRGLQDIADRLYEEVPPRGNHPGDHVDIARIELRKVRERLKKALESYLS